MKKPVLVVMAAGLGSRYGGPKQIQAVGENGQALMDYALYDARRAGFEEAVFIISRAMEKDFPQAISERVGAHLRIRCAVQDLSDIPEGYRLPVGRVKPWGTGHAVRACKAMIDAPFAAINADDYYGPSSFKAIHDFLTGPEASQGGHYAMVGYALSKTLSESGFVARGICKTDHSGRLLEVKERTHIISTHEGALYTENGQIYHRLPDDAIASMNMWGFTLDFMRELDVRFGEFLGVALKSKPLKGEFFLPDVVGAMLREKKAEVSVLPCAERWYGVTYKEDLPIVVEAIRRMTEQGLYPRRLWA